MPKCNVPIYRPTGPSTLTDPVAAARFCLQGSDLLIIGGDQRTHQLERLRREFGLRNVAWASTRESDPAPGRFRSLLQNHHFALVVLLNGLIRHQHARDAAALCEKLGTPLVRIWRSPSPVAIANATLAQVSNRLALSMMN